MFKNRLDPTNIILSGICLLFLLTGCQPTTNQDNEVVLATETIPDEQEAALLTTMTLTSTRSVTQTATSTWTPIPSVTDSPVQQPTLTPLLTETTTPTPWPTLQPDEAAAKVLSLLADNQNPDCLLPCWWGATPGQSHWQDIEPFLNSLAKEIHYSSSETFFGAEVILPLPESVAVINPGDFRAFYGWDKSGIIQGIYVDSINIVGYDAKTMLTLYGVPDEVWLKTLDAPREGVLPFQLIIVYQQQGISFRYYINASTNGEIVTACFEPGVVELERPDLFPAGPYIYVWEAGQYKTIDEIANIPREIYLRLEDTTDLTPKSLYEKFTNPNELPCIETPVDDWMF